MRSAIAMLTAALVLSGAASHAQEPAGTASNPATAAESGTATVKPTVRPAEPNPRTKLLFDVINVLTQPRPAAPPGATAPAPAEPVATALPPAIVPIEPKPAAVAVTPAAQVPPRAVVSRDAGTATALPVPRPGPSATP